MLEESLRAPLLCSALVWPATPQAYCGVPRVLPKQLKSHHEAFMASVQSVNPSAAVWCDLAASTVELILAGSVDGSNAEPLSIRGTVVQTSVLLTFTRKRVSQTKAEIAAVLGMETVEDIEDVLRSLEAARLLVKSRVDGVETMTINTAFLCSPGRKVILPTVGAVKRS